MTTPQREIHHPFAQLLSRYKAVLKASWTHRHELTGPQRSRDETNFLPAALSIQDTPVHPAPRYATWTIIGIFGTMLAWSCIGELDIVAIAPGRIVVSDSSKVIQAPEAGTIKTIKVRDGDHVQEGDELIELDATNATADRLNNEDELAATSSELKRSEALLESLETGAQPSAPLQQPDVELMRSQWADIQAKLAKLHAEFIRRQAELTTAREMTAKLEATLPMALKREEDFKALVADGFVSWHATQDRTRERTELERDLATQRARLSEAKAMLQETHDAKTSFTAETRHTLRDKVSQSRLKLARLNEESIKHRYREQLTVLRAPVAGTVQQLAVHTFNGVVTPAQQLLVIVPDKARMAAEVMIDNKDIGFTQKGQQAEIKIEAFNFTRFGTVPARIARIAKDAVLDEKRGVASFPATLELKQPDIGIEGRRVPLTAGLNITAEIKTGKRTLIEYWLSPVQRKLSESYRER